VILKKRHNIGLLKWPKNINPFFLFLNILVNAYWLFSGWPGTFTGDSVMVLDQIKTGLWNDWHPILYTLYYAVITLGGNYPGLGSLIQVFLLNIAIILFVRNVTLCSLNFAILFNTLLLTTPYIGPYSITVWKDVPYLTFTILGLVQIIKVLRLGVNQFSKKLCLFYFVLGASMRHDGPMTLLVSALVFFCFSFLLLRKWFETQKERKLELTTVSKSLAWAALIGFTIQLATPVLLNAKPKEDSMISMAFLRDLSHIAKNDSGFLDAEEYNLIRSFSDNTSWSFADDCVGPNGYLSPSNFNFDKANLYSLEVLGIWLKHFFSGDAVALLEARACNLSSFSFPILFENKPNNQVLWTACTVSEVAPFDLAAVPTSKSPLKVSLSEFLNSKVCGWPKYLGWPIVFSIFGLIASTFLFVKTRRIEILLLGCVILGRSLILYTFSVAQDFRYALLIHLLAITLITCVFLELFRRPVSSINQDPTKAI
jgi:hypothetical protein